ncbi:MAG: copper oxidase, partial [Nitrospiria bacterium]
NADESYREFNVHLADFQLAYTADNIAVNPPGRKEVGLPYLMEPPVVCPNGTPAPCPEAISADDPGTYSLNYRNEPIALRVRDPLTNKQAAGKAGNLSKAFSSKVLRADPRFNVQPSFYPPLTQGVEPGDPFTPLMRAYENDKVQIRVQVGAHEEEHHISMHGVKWLSEPSDRNSGFRNSQVAGISEHFEIELPRLPILKGEQADYLYKLGSAVDDLWNGNWGLARVYRGLRDDLKPLSYNPLGDAGDEADEELFEDDEIDAADAIVRPVLPRFKSICPKKAPIRKFKITAVSASTALPNGTLVYNSDATYKGILHDPTALLYVRTEDLDVNGKLKPGVPVEPLILRANAGDCIKVKLNNGLPASLVKKNGFSTLPMIVNHFNANQLNPSKRVGLHAQLVAYDVNRSDGNDIGLNRNQTVGRGKQRKYTWYAGDVKVNKLGKRRAIPIEFGAIGLSSSDPIKHTGKGLVGALIIEPKGATWVEDADTRAAATVTKAPTAPGVPGETFREFVLIYQDDLNLRYGNGRAVRNLAESQDPKDSGQRAFNYRAEPIWKRIGHPPQMPLHLTREFDYSNVLSNSHVGGRDPLTPVFTAKVGSEVRFRVVQPGGHSRAHVFQVHGHLWPEEPYKKGSKVLAFNNRSEWKSSQIGIGPSSHHDFLIKKAGGKFGITGDYLYRDMPSFQFDHGLWGIMRVTP